MAARRATALALVALVWSAGCEGAERRSTAEPTPPGAEVGATGSDATATHTPADSSATLGSHP